MELTAKSIAEFLNGKVEGDQEVVVNDVSKIEEGKPGSLTFLANPKYSKYIYTTSASIVIVNDSFVAEKIINSTLIRVEDAYRAFAALLEMYNKNTKKLKGIDPQTHIDKSVVIDESVYVGPFAYIGENARIGKNVQIHPQVFVGDNAEVGDNTILFPGVKVFNNCIVGKDCIIHGGTIIGSDGFGFAPKNQKDYKKVPQIGNVVIEDNVEIGSNSSIDRATMGSTIIRTGVKMDNLVQIAHNVEIGEHTVMASQVGIAGSTKIGKNCMIGGQVGIVNHLTIADEVKIAAQSGVGSSIYEKGAIIQGSPAFNIKEYQKSLVIFKNLPRIQKEIHETSRLVKDFQVLKEDI
ncbi:MAG: UDP-3-O-(3-hydroxymyristoyl)glucosamine N-acyltransferase [Bacteroidales bacterium]|nr:UDP-3-O-(3-hydroxymyristoyl)glucosamine N-acyltransferase [Bacteroidales bacterium]MCF8457152.1 UDP-3-O-(3-hydroxymyristoyl)glucosamine N-acyltransferase [Bacteroidales bacterium]